MKEKILIFKDEKFDIKDTISILIIIMITSGIIGFIYETFFYYLDLGYFVKRGSTYGPWIPIYSVGSLLIVLFTYRFKSKPIVIFFINMIITGTLEFLTGFFLLKVSGLRLWNYNVEKWNFGNINGYVCARSVICFGLSSLLLIYIIVPNVIKIYKNIKIKYLSYCLGIIYLLDVLLYFIINNSK